MDSSRNWLLSITIVVVVCGLLGCGQRTMLSPSSSAANVNESVEANDATAAAALATIEAALSATPASRVTPIFTTPPTEYSTIITLTVTPDQLVTATAQAFPTPTVTMPAIIAGSWLIANGIWLLLLLFFVIVAYMGRNSFVLLVISLAASISIILLTPLGEALTAGFNVGFYTLQPWLLAYGPWTLPLIIALIIIFSQRATIGAMSAQILYLCVRYFITILGILLPIAVGYALRQTMAASSWLTSYQLWISGSVIFAIIVLYREFVRADPESERSHIARILQQALVTPVQRTTQVINASITVVKKIYKPPIPRAVIDESLPVMPRMEVELLKDYILAQPGGKFLLTGYGRFGGTSLVNETMRRVREEYTQGPLLIINFSVTKRGVTLPRNPVMQTFKITANQINLGVLSTRILNESALAEALYQHAESFEQLSQTPSGPLIYHIPVKRNFVARLLTFLFGFWLAAENFNLERFITDLNRALDSGVTTPFLRQWITQFTESTNLPARVIFVFDRLDHFEILKTLVDAQLFENERITVIALTRREELDEWTVGTQQITEIGFHILPVNCIWSGRTDNNGIGYIQGMIKRRLSQIEIPSTYANDFHVLCKYLCYVGHGIPGEIHTHFDRNPWLFTAVEKMIPVNQLPGGELIVLKAWMQEVLELNWHIIAAGWLEPDDEDRARIGTYYLLEWIRAKKQFHLDDLMKAEIQIPITISKYDFVVDEIVRSLLWVLKEHKYLTFEDGYYRPTGPQIKRRKPRRVPYPNLRSLESITPTITRFENADNQTQLEVAIKPQNELPKRKSTLRQTNILFLSANAKGGQLLRLKEEEEAIRQCTQQDESQIQLVMTALPNAGIHEFDQALLAGAYQIVHFAGHTNPEGHLLLAGQNEQESAITLHGFANYIANHESVECVVLNACQSVDQARSIPAQVPIVIAMAGEIVDKAAILFAEGFYSAIAAGKNYQFAFKNGCNRISAELGLKDFSETPQLLPNESRTAES